MRLRGLRGLHLMQDGVEIPFVMTVSEPQSAQTDAARILRLREQDGGIGFRSCDAGAGVHGAGISSAYAGFRGNGGASPAWASFRLFDLSSQHLGRQTMVQLPEMSDSVLHVRCAPQGKKLQMDDLTGVDVPPDRAAQSVYTEVATAENFTNTTRETIAEVDVPAHVRCSASVLQRMRGTFCGACAWRHGRLSDPQ